MSVSSIEKGILKSSISVLILHKEKLSIRAVKQCGQGDIAVTRTKTQKLCPQARAPTCHPPYAAKDQTDSIREATNTMSTSAYLAINLSHTRITFLKKF